MKQKEKNLRNGERENPKKIIDNELPVVNKGTVWLKEKWLGLTKKDKKKLKKKPETSFLVHMFFSNGTSKEFVIETKEEIFTYKGKAYYLRYEDSWYNLTQNQYELNYFDDYSTPLDRKVVKIGDKKYWSVTAQNLKPLFQMQYVKVLANSQELDKYLRMTATLSTVCMIGVLILLMVCIKILRSLP